uniref:Uncharacterized protein n=1 Tax=Plectus sambesii TaxID=2011161 RepID=A0A914XF60_9BILA
MASDITAKEKLLEMDNEVLLIERERKCMNVSRFNLREYICGPRMRLYTAVKLLTSFTYAALLMTVIVNFNVIDTHLNKLNITKNNDIVADGSDRRQYYIVLWLGFLLCVLHSLTCVVTVVSSFCSRTREYLSHVVHVTWWLIFAMTAVIPIFSFILYFGFLPRAVQETFTQLSDAARTDYKSILPLQEVVVKRLPPPILEPYVIYRSQEPKKETCTAKIMSHYPDKVRWVWILKASAIPHTAFGWIVVFDLIFIITAWSERGYYNVEDDEAN